MFSPFLLLLAPIQALAQTYSATYLPSNAPAQSEQGQSGTNQCGTDFNQTSNCQNAYINSVTDFCVWAPPNPGANSTIGDTERIEVAWCTKNGTGTRLIPDGAITGAHFVQTPDFVQVTVSIALYRYRYRYCQLWSYSCSESMIIDWGFTAAVCMPGGDAAE
ncbi:hypothetical protein H0H92_007338 [Tricholoma furcatifolium]|nr:hypothetical protein H0H92_007338 [Tricholoma furcatifolium]